MEPRAVTVWRPKKNNTQLWWARLSCQPITTPNFWWIPFPTRSPKVTPLWLTRYLLNSSRPLQLTAIRMGAKTKRCGKMLSLAFRINRKGWTQASPGPGLPSGNSGLSAAAVVRVVQQIHLLNDNSFIGKPIQLKPLHPTKSPAALSA